MGVLKMLAQNDMERVCRRTDFNPFSEERNKFRSTKGQTCPRAGSDAAGLTPDALCVRTPLPNVSIVRANQHLAAHNTPCPETTGLRQFAL